MRMLPLIATAVVSAIAAVLTTWPLARDMGRATLASGEVLLTAWQINWFHQALLTNPLTWAHANIFFPYDSAATFNDLLLTHALVTLPIAWITSPVAGLNLALLGGIVLCGVCAHLLIEELCEDPWAAMVGATLFALAPFRFLHLMHVSIAAAWAVPLFFWALLRHMREPSWPRATLVAGCGVLVAFSSLYHAAYVAPILPLILLVAARRGPGGRRVWMPLLVAGGSGLVLVAWFLLPFATTLRDFGPGAAPDDLLRYRADLSSFGLKPDFLGGKGAPGLEPEAHLFPGTALALLASVGVGLIVMSVAYVRGWRRAAAAVLLTLAGVTAAGVILPLPAAAGALWRTAAIALIWLGPAAAVAWAIALAAPAGARSPAGALRLGAAGAVWSFALALGPEARHLNDILGPAPYVVLSSASSFFEGTRVPARFGGISMLFLAVLAAGALAHIRGARHRSAGAGVATLAIVVCLAELPVPALPEGRPLVALPDLRNPAYAWLRSQPGRLGVLELPDWPSDAAVHYEHRDWRSLRYMLASKQHGQHLVNGTGRIEPFLWQRFRTLDLWSDDFFTFIVSYLPVDYVLVHEAGVPVADRAALWARLESAATGWRRVFLSPSTRVYAIDRAVGRGTVIDRIVLRRGLTPGANLRFEVRAAGAVNGAGGEPPAPAAIELLLDGELVETWPVQSGWQQLQVTLPINRVAPDVYETRCLAGQPPCIGWPRAGVLLRWRTRGDSPGPFEIRNLSIVPAQTSPH
ncbi:MAG TPA: hypothetical protein VIY56_05960 [Vicinamibacterales bacterium]